MKRAAVGLLLCYLCGGGQPAAQDITVSPPQKVSSGAATFDILGKTREGILVHYQLRESHVLYAFDANMQLRWRKNLNLRERQASIRYVLLTGDSLTVLYTLPNRGQLMLHAARYALHAEQPLRTLTLDTLTPVMLGSSPALRVRQSADERYMVVWHEDAFFSTNNKFYVSCYDRHLRRVWKQVVVLENFNDPELMDGTPDTSGNFFVVAGDRRSRTTQSAFVYRKLLLMHLRADGRRHSAGVGADNILLTDAMLNRSYGGQQVLLGGLYLQSGAREAGGHYFLVYDTVTDSVRVRSFAGHTAEAAGEGQRTGTGRPSPLSAYRPLELVVTRTGGAFLVSEAQDISTELFPNPTYGTFGMTSGFAVSYFHYDDVSVVAFRADGQPEWRKVLRKRQNTEGDGGYYSSISLLIAPERLYFLFNDFTTGSGITSYYVLDASGNVERNQLFNAERMGLWPVLREGRQISPYELLVPSLRKNYLQFIRIRF